MKVKAGEPVDGKIALSISATADEVTDAINYLIGKCASENGIDYKQSTDVEFDLRAKLGAEFLSAYLNTQVPQFLAAKAVGVAKLSTVLNPEVRSRLSSVQRNKAIEFRANVFAKPELTLSSYEPISIDVPEITVGEDEVDAQIYMLAET
ncbi:MAG: trigger factor family protein, partial [Coriobacteriia bacterium]|nr:trigger factor family protein [Coriobacteriia bacterium]